MEIRYQRNHKESYMIVEGTPGWACYEEHMLRQNQISSLLSFYTMEINGNVQFWYDITGKESLKDYVDQELSLERFEKVMSYLGFAYEELQKYLICQEHILLSPETIYIAHKNQPFAVYLCCYPGGNRKMMEQLQGVMEYLLSIVDHRKEGLANLCYTVYDRAVSGACGFGELMDCIYQSKAVQQNDIEKIQEEMLIAKEHTVPEERAVLEKEELPSVEDTFPMPLEEGVSAMILGTMSALQKKGKAILQMIRSWMPKREEKTEGEDFIFEPSREIMQPTTLLYSGEENCVGRLVYDGEDKEDSFLITQEIFRIGSSEENDACLHTRTVSRRHARITVRQKEYYLEDLNSTNGTYVNDVVLNYNEPVCLHAMDHVRFADVPYIFL